MWIFTGSMRPARAPQIEFQTSRAVPETVYKYDDDNNVADLPDLPGVPGVAGPIAPHQVLDDSESKSEHDDSESTSDHDEYMTGTEENPIAIDSDEEVSKSDTAPPIHQESLTTIASNSKLLPISSTPEESRKYRK